MRDPVLEDSCEFSFSKNRNPRHWRPQASQHLSPCLIRVTKPVKANKWPNRLWYQLKERTRRSEGGEWEPIKISHRNLTYIPKSTWSPSLLTRPKLTRYRQVIGLRNRAMNRNRNTKRYLARPRARSTIKIRPKNNLYPHSHSSEHLVCAFGKLPRESNLNHKTSSLFIWWLKSYTGFSLQRFIHCSTTQS
jgi:hypothetical protein